MTLKQISYETFFQPRLNVSLLFFNIVSTLKQRRCDCLGDLGLWIFDMQAAFDTSDTH